MKEKFITFFNGARKFLLNPHLVICYAIAWIITNGWAYIGIGVGTYYDMDWLRKVSVAYLAILWSPFCFEIIITLIITMALLKLFFPKDKETLHKIQVYYRYTRIRIKKIKRARREKREKLRMPHR